MSMKADQATVRHGQQAILQAGGAGIVPSHLAVSLFAKALGETGGVRS